MLTLSQAALELLGTAVVVDRDQTIPFPKWDKQNAAWRVRRLLRGTIPLSVPKNLATLNQPSATHAWGDGPTAVANLRNTVSHWTTGKPRVDTQVWVESAQLALHYLEMALLSSIGYTGRAIDRTVQPISAGGSTRVPWA